MTPAAELWAAVVKHCATGRGYAMDIRNEPPQVRFKVNARTVCRAVMAGKWKAESGPFGDIVTIYDTADEAVRAALRIVAPSTEPNVSC